MRPKHNDQFSQHGRSHRVRGFSVVSAIFLLVVLSTIAAFMVNLSSVQNITSAQDVQGTRAYQAARSGMEWGLYQALVNDACTPSSSVPVSGTLAGFAVSVACLAFPYDENGSTGKVFQITATASLGTPGTATYVERQLQASAGR